MRNVIPLGKAPRKGGRSARRLLERYDASALIGLPVIAVGAVFEVREPDDVDGPSIAIPNIAGLSAAAALARCLSPLRLRGREAKALRKIVGLTQPELCVAIGGDTAVETISRWETKDDRPVSAYVERLVRLAVCERLKALAPGVAYEPLNVVGLKIVDRAKKMAPMVFRQERRKVGRTIEATWVHVDATAAMKAAA